MIGPSRLGRSSQISKIFRPLLLLKMLISLSNHLLTHQLLLMTIMIESKLEGEGSSPAAHASSLSSADAGEEEHTRQVTMMLMLSLVMGVVMVVTVWEKRNTFDGWMVMLTGLGFADGGDVDVGDGGGSHGCVGENRDQVGDPLDGGGGV